MKNKKEKQLLLEQLKENPIVQIACKKIGIGRATYYRWRKEDHEFAKAAEEAIAEGTLLINDVAESQLMSAIKDKNMTAIIFWLRNHHGSYANKLEIKGHLKYTSEDLSPDEKEMLKEALKLALPQKAKENGERKTNSQ